MLNQILLHRYDSEGHSNGTVRYNDIGDPIKLNWEFDEQVRNFAFLLHRNVISNNYLNLFFFLKRLKQ